MAAYLFSPKGVGGVIWADGGQILPPVELSAPAQITVAENPGGIIDTLIPGGETESVAVGIGTAGSKAEKIVLFPG